MKGVKTMSLLWDSCDSRYDRDKSDEDERLEEERKKQLYWMLYDDDMRMMEQAKLDDDLYEED